MAGSGALEPSPAWGVVLILKKLQFSLLAAMLGLAAFTAPLVALAADAWVNTNSGVYSCAE